MYFEELNNMDGELKIEEELIDAVKKRRCIYVKGLTKQMKLKEKAWAEIAEEVGEDESFCRRRWTSLRDRFVRELRKHKLCPDTYPKWEYFDKMGFIQRNVRHTDASLVQKRLNYLRSISPSCSKSAKDVNDFENSSIVEDNSLDADYSFEVDYSLEPDYSFDAPNKSLGSPTSSHEINEDKQSVKKEYVIEEEDDDDDEEVNEEKNKSKENIKKQMQKEINKRDDISSFLENVEQLIREANFTTFEKIDLQINILKLVKLMIAKKVK